MNAMSIEALDAAQGALAMLGSAVDDGTVRDAAQRLSSLNARANAARRLGGATDRSARAGVPRLTLRPTLPQSR